MRSWSFYYRRNFLCGIGILVAIDIFSRTFVYINLKDYPLKRAVHEVHHGVYPTTVGNSPMDSIEESEDHTGMGCSEMASKRFPFIFSVDENAIFGPNIKGLNESLKCAVSQGCLRSSLASIEIIFTAKLQPSVNTSSSAAYIQYQMEQLTSPFFSQSYVAKLRNAMQVWYFSPTMLGKVEQQYGLDNGFYIPHLLTRAKTADYRDIKNSRISSGKFTLFWQKLYYSINIQNGALSLLSPDSELDVSDDIRLLVDNFDVLFFGTMRHSFKNQRERLCSGLQNSGIKILCVEASGRVLDWLISQAKVILVDSFYQNASLGLHRVDDLLLRRKSIVSIASKDNFLNWKYSSSVQFASYDTVARTLNYSLSNIQNMETSIDTNYYSWRSSMTDTSPLCYALQQIP